MNPDIRWKQRFENYEKALLLLREALADVETLSEKERVMNRFGLTDSEQELIRDALRRHTEVSEVKTFGSHFLLHARRHCRRTGRIVRCVWSDWLCV